MDTLWQDVRYAVRTLRARPGFTAVAVLTLALGIGANTAIFSLVNSVFFKGVSGGIETDRLVEVIRIQDGRHFDLAYPVFQHLRTHGEILEDAAAFTAIPMAVTVADDPQVHMAFTVSGNYLSLLGLAPARGRFFSPDESFHPNVADEIVISHRLWQERFGGRADVLGSVVQINGHSVEVVGVAPRGFHGHAAALVADLWVPMGVAAPGLHSSGSLSGRSSPGSSSVALSNGSPSASSSADATGCSGTRSPTVRRFAWLTDQGERRLPGLSERYKIYEFVPIEALTSPLDTDVEGQLNQMENQLRHDA